MRRLGATTARREGAARASTRPGGATLRLAPVALAIAVGVGCGPAPTPPGTSVAPAPAAPVAAPGIPLAVTLDDLPYVGPTPRGISRTAALQRIVAAIEAAQAPVTGFVTCGRLDDEQGGLTPWLAAGLPVANHSTAHRSVDDLGRDGFVADARACRERLATITGKRPKYFRYPFLQTGAERGLRDAVAADIAGLGMGRAPVSVDTSDWALAGPYAEAVSAGDEARAASIADAYVEHVRRAAARYRGLAKARVGREVAQVLLLHANSLASDQLGRLLIALRGDGFRFVTLEQALEDPVYAQEDDWVDPVGASWLLRIPPATPALWGWDHGQQRALTHRFDVGADEQQEERIGPHLRAQRLADHPAWRIVHTTPIAANALVFRTPSGETVLADTPWTPEATRDLLDWIAARFGALPSLATVSHFHLDAAGGIAALEAAGVPVAVSDRTAKLLAEKGEAMRESLADAHGEAFECFRVAAPQATFPLVEGFRTTVGGADVRIVFPGHGHAPDNVVTWFPESGVMFGGCMVKGGDNLGYLGDANRETWPAAMQALLALAPKVVVPGHGARTDPEQLSHTAKLLADDAPGVD